MLRVLKRLGFYTVINSCCLDSCGISIAETDSIVTYFGWHENGDGSEGGHLFYLPNGTFAWQPGVWGPKKLCENEWTREI